MIWCLLALAYTFYEPSLVVTGNNGKKYVELRANGGASVRAVPVTITVSRNGKNGISRKDVC